MAKKKGFGSRPSQNANDKQHERAKNGGGRVNRMSGHMMPKTRVFVTTSDNDRV